MGVLSFVPAGSYIWTFHYSSFSQTFLFFKFISFILLGHWLKTNNIALNGQDLNFTDIVQGCVQLCYILYAGTFMNYAETSAKSQIKEGIKRKWEANTKLNSHQICECL